MENDNVSCIIRQDEWFQADRRSARGGACYDIAPSVPATVLIEVCSTDWQVSGGRGGGAAWGYTCIS
jgi:hypothetical protein